MRSGDGFEWGTARRLGLLLVGVLAGAAGAQPKPGGGERVDAALCARMVERVSKALNEEYVFPEVAQKMEARLREQLKAGAYDKASTSSELADLLSRDVREVSKDKHLRIEYEPTAPPGLDGAPPTDAEREQFRRRMAQLNFGFEKVERLAGNVGYLDLRGFMDAGIAGETAIAAMGFLANSDALIIDLRRNGGGSPTMIQLLTSYLFDKPVHLNSFYIRKGDKTQQFWTSAHVQGKRMPKTDVYVLTSGRTFSAAEEFTYNLKNLKRATIIGETTGGGAHPVDAHYLADVHLVATIPFGRAVNPITNTNWEGVGVAPDIQVPADKALETAHLKALEKLKERAKDERERQRLSWAFEKVQALAHPPQVSAEVLKRYAGTYGTRTLSLENGSLYFEQLGGGLKLRLIPLSNDVLLPEGLDWFRVKMDKDASGKVIGLTWLAEDGQAEKAPRTASR